VLVTIFALVNRKYIILIIIIISIALIGLVSIQVYWIKNTISVKEGNFDRNVNEAITNVIYKLEKIEVANQIRQKEVYFQRSSSIARDIDSLDYQYYQELESIRGGDNAESDEDAQNRIDDIIEQKSDLFTDVFEDMYAFSRLRTIEERVNSAMLDSLITAELTMQGINTDYEFGVYSTAQNRMILEKTGQFTKQLFEESFGFILFPSDLFVNPDYLMVFFPKETKYLFSQLSGILTIAIILIVVIIISFVFTINSVIRQQKFSEMKSDFINNMTHEFKTPISTISLACEALKDTDMRKIADVTDNYVGVISEENKRLGNMAEKILLTAVLEKGKLKLTKEQVNIHKVIMEVIKNIGIQVEINDGEIIRDFRATSPLINADKMHLTNVIFNLMENANKYSPKKPKIEISTYNIAEGVEIAVKDNGIGIGKADQKKIFDKLYRVPTGDVHDFKGFGLGLSYVKAIVDKHGGEIRLESEVGQGSVFTVFLPVGGDKI